jgi:hypothetical protein
MPMPCSLVCKDLASDVANCGACGSVCPAGATCNLGVCACMPPNNMGCNGVCTNTLADTANCGSCNHACAVGATCTNGSCVCPGVMGTNCNGTCADIASDPGNCGGCGLVCTVMGSTCTNGVCGCTTGATPMNCGGACTDLSSDPNNCGGCGKVCPSLNATASCTAGKCGFTCNRGFGDCDGLAANACELFIGGFDTSNCGACGHVCSLSGTVCTRGVCQYESFTSSPQVVQMTANDATYVYWTVAGSPSRVFRLNKDGTNPVTLSSTTNGAFQLAVDSMNVYFSTSAGLYGVPILGTTGAMPVDANHNPVWVALDASNVYYSDPTGIWQIAKTVGATPSQVVSSLAPGRFAIDSTYVYWVDTTSTPGTTLLVKQLLAGGATQTLVTGMASPGPIAVDATSVYFLSGGGSSLSKSNLDGTNVRLVTGGLGNNLVDFVVDGTNAYVSTGSSLYEAPLGGQGNTFAIAGGLATIQGLSQDPSNVYFVEATYSIVARAAK